MRIGIVCYASAGGSGVVATELAIELAARGHDLHLISSDAPFRYAGDTDRLTLHHVETPAYPLFREPQYALSLATRIVHVARERSLDVVHAHYAVPHATAAYLARQILARSGRGPVARIVTTLHGTDITLVGSDPSYSETVAFSIDQSDAVTAVSESLRADTYRSLGIRKDVRVIYNFLDTERFRRLDPAARAAGDPLVVHISNFRPVKRIDAVIDVFRRIRQRRPARLLLVGDGPEQGTARRLIAEHGLGDSVQFAGEQENVVALLSRADLFLLPSATESFGLAALEAMACGVPVVASRVGGLPEVIDHGQTGFLHPPDDLEGMAASGLALLDDSALHAATATAARQAVVDRFCAGIIVPQYERLYEELV